MGFHLIDIFICYIFLYIVYFLYVAKIPYPFATLSFLMGFSLYAYFFKKNQGRILQVHKAASPFPCIALYFSGI